METIFKVEVVYTNRPRRYYRADTWGYDIGYFSSLECAESIIKEYKERDSLFCFKISEYPINSDITCDLYLSVRTYNAAGELNDTSIMPRRRLYKGRKPEDLRFHVGDIIEYADCGIVESAIVADEPPTPEFCARWVKRSMEYYHIESEDELVNHHTHIDESDDSYTVLSMGKGDTHAHPNTWNVFPHSRPITPFLRKGLEQKLKEY